MNQELQDSACNLVLLSKNNTCSPPGQKWGQVVESAATQPKFWNKELKIKFCGSTSWISKIKSLLELYAPETQYGARPVVISKISLLKLSPGRLWRLGGFQRLDTSSVFWPRRSQSASAEVPVSWSRKSKSASQKNPHQEKLLSSLKEKM